MNLIKQTLEKNNVLNSVKISKKDKKIIHQEIKVI